MRTFLMIACLLSLTACVSHRPTDEDVYIERHRLYTQDGRHGTIDGNRVHMQDGTNGNVR